MYVFRKASGSWNEETKLISSEQENFESFGSSIGISNDGRTLAVGSFSDDGAGGSNQGSGYLFTYDSGTWSQKSKVLAPDGFAWDSFGTGVSLSGDGTTVGFGSPGDDVAGGTQRGAIYIFISN